MRRVRRVLGYARVSGAEQGRTGTSLEGQQDEIRRYCAAHNLPAPDIRVEVESAGAEKLERRAVLRQLLADAREGDLVVVAKQDRWSRDTLFYLQSIRDLNARGVRFTSIAERFDPETPEGRFASTLMAAVAEQERERIIQRTVGRRKSLRAQGKYVEGRPPLGYRRGPGNVLEVVPAAGEVVLELFRKCARGTSLRELSAWLKLEHPEHARHWAVLRDALRSRVYLGEVRADRGGDWIAGAHEPIVTAALWTKAQAALDRRKLGGRRAGPRTDDWLLRSFARCARCGAAMGSAYGPSPDPKTYYACWSRLRKGGCRARYVPVEQADRDAARLVREHLEELRATLATAPEPPSSPQADLAPARKKLQGRRDRLIDMAADGTISREELRRRLAVVDADLAAVAAEDAARSAKDAARRPEARAELLRQVRRLRGAWKRASVADRRELVVRLATSVAIAAGEPPVFEWRTVAELVTDL